VGLVLLCAALIVYAGIDVVKDISLVNEAFPSLPSEFAGDLKTSLLLSPAKLQLHRFENGFLRWIQYPPLTLPYAGLPTGDPIGDEIYDAQEKQGLITELGSGGLHSLDEMMHLKPSSLDAVGRAIYLSQERPAGPRGIEHSEVASMVGPGFEKESAVEQLRQIFEIAYGEKALQEATRPER
jgi:hypothetical protein